MLIIMGRELVQIVKGIPWFIANKKAGHKGPVFHKRYFHRWFLGDRLKLIPFKRGYCQL